MNNNDDEDYIEFISDDDTATVDTIVKIGVVGTSRRGLVDRETAKLAVFEALDLLHKEYSPEKKIAIVSGGGLVPEFAFKWAKLHGESGIQVVSTAVRGTPKGVTERVEIGKNHGDESEYFINTIDLIVRVGGGPQSHAEVKSFRQRLPEGVVVERDIPFISAAAAASSEGQKRRKP